MKLWLHLFLLFILAWLLTGLVRTMARRANLIDVPNLRSSHKLPTPRGGGLAIVLSLAAVSPWLAGEDASSSLIVVSILPAALAVALIGFVDDRWQLPAWPRALVQIISGAWILYQMPELPVIEILGLNFSASPIGVVLLLLYLVWFTNLFNFMDGTDGIAASQAILISVGTAILLSLNIGGMTWVWPMALAYCCVAFLTWNWPPARIFMGDVGSGFLGLLFSGMSLVYGLMAPVLFWAMLILQGMLIVDATTTIFRRFANGEQLTVAHCSHAYQHLGRRIGHRSVMFAYGAITTFWLFPLALLVEDGTFVGPVGLLLAYGPLVVLANRFGAGVP